MYYLLADLLYEINFNKNKYIIIIIKKEDRQPGKWRKLYHSVRKRSANFIS